MIDPQIINGSERADFRGKIRFINDFDMIQVKRFYIISNADNDVVRAWRAHRIEQRWFHVIKGSFKIKAVRIDNWDTPSKVAVKSSFELTCKQMQVLHLPVGYASSLQALEENSEVMVFADYGIENAKHDDYLYPVDYFG